MTDGMSPEIDLLERLSAEDASLWESAYGSYCKFRDLDHAIQAVNFLLKADFVELYDNAAESKNTIAYHTSRWLIRELSNWEKSTSYFLRITGKGYEKFVEDSEGFFDDLFGKMKDDK